MTVFESLESINYVIEASREADWDFEEIITFSHRKAAIDLAKTMQKQYPHRAIRIMKRTVERVYWETSPLSGGRSRR